ncbi:MAG: potassium channel family protein [Candidatus Limnocylindrales bacterium]|nr:potassium channel family protein [Candidatus Limnocylindrales bacterium]
MRISALAHFGGSHVRLWVAAVVLVAAVGSVGYVALGWPIGDAVYMTGITLTIVGYREVRELDGLGRAWTILVAVAGVGIIARTASSPWRSSAAITTTSRTRSPIGSWSRART